MGANSLRLGSYQKHNLAGADTQNDWFRYVLLGAVQNGRVFSTAPPPETINYAFELKLYGVMEDRASFGRNKIWQRRLHLLRVCCLAGWLAGWCFATSQTRVN